MTRSKRCEGGRVGRRSALAGTQLAIILLCGVPFAKSLATSQAHAGKSSALGSRAKYARGVLTHNEMGVRPSRRDSSLCMGFSSSQHDRNRKRGSNRVGGNHDSERSNVKRGWVAGVRSVFAPSPANRAHDEVTFRRGYEGRTLTIPQAERYSSAAWWHNVRTLPTSVILNRIKQPLFAQTCWATAVSLVHLAFGGTWSMSVKPHTLLGSALGLLLVFRTNAGYQRFQEGRKLWEEVLNTSRDIARMAFLYQDVFGTRLVRRIGNLVACHSVILQEHVQGFKQPKVWEDLVREKEVNELMTTTCNRPLLVVNKISKEIRDVPYKSEDWTSRERLAILALCNKLAATIGGCERLVQTPVPLHYVRHTSRFLTIWCFLLPLVIVGELGMATAPVVCLATWALFGIQEIGLLIEDPFQSALKLDIMCNTVYLDVMQTIGVSDPTQPQQPIPMQGGISATDFMPGAAKHDPEPLSSRCRHPATGVETTRMSETYAGSSF